MELNETIKEDIVNAGIEYTLSTNPVCICGGNFADTIRGFNRNLAFEAGAEWVLSQLETINEEELDKIAYTPEVLNKLRIPYDDCVEECVDCWKEGFRKALNYFKQQVGGENEVL